MPLEVSDRRVSGLVMAYRGRGVIFLDSKLDAGEGRVILAHEFAHYLLDYLQPRDRLLRRMGAELIPVLDGVRPVEPSEEWAALFAGVSLGVHTHFLARDFTPGDRSPIPAVERLAKDLARAIDINLEQVRLNA